MLHLRPRRRRRLASIVSIACVAALLVGCPPLADSGDAAILDAAVHPDGGRSDGGADGDADGGADGGADGSAGGDADGGERPDSGQLDLETLIGRGAVATQVAPRPDFGGVLAVAHGTRLYALESRRDLEPGPYELPWRSRFRLAAYDDGGVLWSYAAAADDVLSDVVVHPSGDLTIALLRHPPERRAYDSIRLDPDGTVRRVTTLDEPATIPLSDRWATDPTPLFRMKSDFADATVGGWVRLLPAGEAVVVAFLSFIDVPDGGFDRHLALGLATFDEGDGGYVERWARVVEGSHFAEPAAWAYDELRWSEQAIRPFLARDESTGDLLVARAWNQARCRANAQVFAEVTQQDCLLGAASTWEVERLPLAVTRFGPTGVRKGTRILAPDADAAEQVAFGLAAREGRLAVTGTVVRVLPDGSKRTYPDPAGYVDYDGYIAIYDSDGGQVLRHDFNLGRGDVLAGLRWTPAGLVAVGSAGWDRWQGGMSISRGADPLIIFLSSDGTRAASRVVAHSDGSRHFTLHDVVVAPNEVVGIGFSDAPMTHSADQGRDSERTFGPLRLIFRAE